MQIPTSALSFELGFKSLQGLAIGDAFGDSFFGNYEQILTHIHTRTIPKTTLWEFTDDTVMGIGILQHLQQYGQVQPDQLAQTFALNYNKDPKRGYGATARRLLEDVQAGGDWKILSPAVFDGQGSMGNGAAMRAAPLGAFFYPFEDNFERVKPQSELAAMVTHAHLEAQTGALAIALAAMWVIWEKDTEQPLSAEDFIRLILEELPPSDTTSKISKALSFPKDTHIDTLVNVLGNGKNLMSQDSVPFSIWCIAHYRDNFEEALWAAVSALGDRDTICAMVGSVVILSAPSETIPALWKNSVETVENSIFWV